MIVLDTTVLVYAKGADHPYRDPCRELVAAVADNRIEATTSVEVIQEFVHVRARRRGRSDAAALGAAYVELLSPLMEVTREHLERGLDLFRATTKLRPFDAILAAACLAKGAHALVSADSAFAEAPSLRHVLPDEAGVKELLSRS